MSTYDVTIISNGLAHRRAIIASSPQEARATARNLGEVEHIFEIPPNPECCPECGWSPLPSVSRLLRETSQERLARHMQFHVHS